MAVPTSSSIRVFVRWKEQTVFAGEDVECEITFKNVAANPSSHRASPNNNPSPFQPPSHRKAPSSQIKGSPLNPHSAPTGRGHRSTLSLTVPTNSSRPPVVSGSWPSKQSVKTPQDAGKHKRSVSIISIPANESATDDISSQTGRGERGRPSRGHGRAASLQILPRGSGLNGAPVGPSHRSATHPPPLFSFPSAGILDHERPSRRRPGATSVPSTPILPRQPPARRKASEGLPQTWKFPTSPILGPEIESVVDNDGESITDGKDYATSPRTESLYLQHLPKNTPVTRIISPASISGTPRSSGEFYSMSNNSTETLASEYVPQHTTRASQGGHIRRPSNLPPAQLHKPPETLMMGFAQINGSFTLDSALIRQSPFDEVKRKGAVGGQGGGVVGIETNKRESGILGGFGWSSFGSSFGGLLGGSELSSMKDMRGVASSKSIPLLLTPQSILFVDLRLAPGESKSYEYSFKLPRGLPPSHRGKAIKISYKLVIGTQRPGGAKEQQVKSIEIPFRILGSVNSYGELLGHDLMSPYIILRDQARVKTIEHSSSWQFPKPAGKDAKKKDTSNDFLRYVEELLTRPRQNSHMGLLSPTEAPRSRRQSYVEEPSTVKEIIDMAILRSNVATEMQQSANKFEIARGGKRVAVVMLARPAYRLGETVHATIDFNEAKIPCYAVHMSLETSERVDSSIALRSEASIQRVTKKVYVSHSESTLFARRVVFSPDIPITATPEFMTTGVSLDWKLRVEFVTPTLISEGNSMVPHETELMEEISHDDRGSVFASAETLSCESFEIAVPIRVYGAMGIGERDDGDVEGLVV